MMRILQCIVIVQSFLRLLKLHKLAVCKGGGGGLTWCHGVLAHGLNLHRNIPLTSVHTGRVGTQVGNFS